MCTIETSRRGPQPSWSMQVTLRESLSSLPANHRTILCSCFSGEGQSFWQVRQWDPDLSLSSTLPPTWGGLGKPGAKQRALSALPEGPGFDDVREAILATEESLIFERRMMDRLPLDSWSHPSGRVVLLGDGTLRSGLYLQLQLTRFLPAPAAHAMYPGPGEGARQAFEDAHQLSLALGEALAQRGGKGLVLSVIVCVC